MKGFLAAVISIAAFAPRAAAQAPAHIVPSSVQASADTPAVEQAKRLLRGAVTTDEASFRRLVKEIYPAAEAEAVQGGSPERC